MSSRKYLKQFLGALTILVFSFFLVSCAPRKEDDRPIVYTSFFPIYDLTQQVAGDVLDVRSFMPENQDPHIWEPAPRDLLALTKAELMFINGANLEKWTHQVQENVPDLEIVNLSNSVDLITYKGQAALGDFQYLAKVYLEAGKDYPIIFGHSHEEGMRMAVFQSDETDKKLIDEAKEIMEDQGRFIKQKEHFLAQPQQVYDLELGHQTGEITFQVPKTGDYYFVSDRLSEDILSYQLTDDTGQEIDREVVMEGSSSELDRVTYDPHSWMSIVNAKRYLADITEELSTRFPEHARTLNRNRSKYVQQLTGIELEFLDKFLEKEINEFLVTHNAYGYLARDFRLVQFSVMDLVTSEAPSLNTIKTAVDFAQEYGIEAIYYESGKESKQAQVLAEEIDGEIVPLISMEYKVDTNIIDDYSYAEIMRYNLQQIYEGVK